MRNGLDMAFSSNQVQLRNWGKAAGIAYPTDKNKLPAASLDYWIWANTRAIKNGQALGKNFLLINFEAFCINPVEGVKKLFDFIEMEPDEALMNKFISLPKLPETTGRYKKEDISIFKTEQLNAVIELGYNI